jgi:hypothetical protein
MMRLGIMLLQWHHMGKQDPVFLEIQEAMMLLTYLKIMIGPPRLLLLSLVELVLGVSILSLV